MFKKNIYFNYRLTGKQKVKCKQEFFVFGVNVGLCSRITKQPAKGRREKWKMRV